MTVQRRAVKHPDDEDAIDPVLHYKLQHQPGVDQSTEEEEEQNKKQGEVRQIQKKKKNGPVAATATATATSASASNAISVYDVLRLVLGLFVVSCALSFYVTGDGLFWGHRPWFTRVDVVKAWLVRLISFVFSPLSLSPFHSFVLLYRCRKEWCLDVAREDLGRVWMT